MLADEAKAFALKQPSSHDDKTSFEEIPKERKEDLSTNDMDEFAKNISGRYYKIDQRYSKFWNVAWCKLLFL